MNLSFSKWLLIEEADIGSVAQSVYNAMTSMKHDPSLIQRKRSSH